MEIFVHLISFVRGMKIFISTIFGDLLAIIVIIRSKFGENESLK